MPFTLAALKSELQNDPANLGYNSHVNAGSHGTLSAMLNNPVYDGYIPPTPLQNLLLEAGLIAILDLVADHRLLPAAANTAPTVAAPTGLIVLAYQLRRVFQFGKRMSVAAASAGCDTLVSAGLMPPPTKQEVLALKVKIGRAAVLFDDYDVKPTAQDVYDALRS